MTIIIHTRKSTLREEDNLSRLKTKEMMICKEYSIKELYELN